MHLNAQLLQMQRQMASMQGFTEALHHEVVILGKDQKRGRERERETAYQEARDKFPWGKEQCCIQRRILQSVQTVAPREE